MISNFVYGFLPAMAFYGALPAVAIYGAMTWIFPRWILKSDPVKGQRKGIYEVALVASGFVILVAGFKIGDPYNTLFFDQSWAFHCLHLIGRILFCFYFFVILFGFGQIGLIINRRIGISFRLSASEEIAISVLLGSALLRIAMYFLGLLSAYYWVLLLVLGTAGLCIGWSRFRALIASSLNSSAMRWTTGIDSTERIVRSLIIGALLSAMFVVMIGKFLYPNGTGDYFSHYFPYYKEVIRAGSIWPNQVWYHFFISKGLGDVFFSIALSDLLGSLATSFAMVVLGLVIVYSMARKIFDDVVIALAAAALSAVSFMWTFDQVLGFGHWAEFAKQHVITSVLFLGCVWASWLQLGMQGRRAWGWGALTTVVYCGLVLLRPQFILLLSIYLLFMIGYACISRNRASALMYCLTLLISASLLGGILILNYLMTGMPEITPFRTFWPYADQARFAQWVSPFLMLLLELGSSPDLGSVGAPNLDQFNFFKLLAIVFRAESARPAFGLFGIPLVAVLISGWFVFISGKKPDPLSSNFRSGLVVLISMFLAAVLAFFSVNQIGSVYRLYVFCIFPMVMFSLLPFGVLRSSLGRTKWFHSTVGIALACISIFAVQNTIGKIPVQQLTSYYQFAKGASNIRDAYAAQNAVWGPGLEIVKIVGADVPVWSSQVTGQFCVAPGCNFETFFSYSMGPEWATIIFDDAARARAALVKAGLNHFAIDTKAPFFDLLPYSSLFDPKNIRSNLALEWTDGSVYLLTWPSAKTTPIPEEFMARYISSINAAKPFADFSGLHSALGGVYQAWKQQPAWPIKIDPSKPRPKGWQ